MNVYFSLSILLFHNYFHQGTTASSLHNWTKCADTAFHRLSFIEIRWKGPGYQALYVNLNNNTPLFRNGSFFMQACFFSVSLGRIEYRKNTRELRSNNADLSKTHALPIRVEWCDTICSNNFAKRFWICFLWRIRTRKKHSFWVYTLLPCDEKRITYEIRFSYNTSPI